MVRSISLLSMITAALAWAQPVSIDGNIILVQDPNGAINALVGMQNMSILPSHQEQFCRQAYNTVRAAGIPDEFDGVITFTASEQLTDIDNVWQGSPVRADGTGYGRQNAPWANTYMSSKLGQCVFMGTLGRTMSLFGPPGPEALPSDPEGAWSPSIGIQIPGFSSLTGIEMMGHEYGHHWLLGIEFDQNDGRGRQHFIRGYNEGDPNSGSMGYPNQHYSHNADSRSVMYGECITDLGGGSFKFEGCPRKYSQIDQYLMGLRGPTEVNPMMVLEDPSAPGQGVDSVAMGRSSGSMTVNGLTRHDISADEIIRAMGSRIPGYPNAASCWRVAFIVVMAPGQTTVPQAMLDKVKRYAARWPQWFYGATDCRGTMDTRITGSGCVAIPNTCDADGGTMMQPDSGVIAQDAGQPDAGAPEEDAGLDAGTPGEELDAGNEMMPPVGGGIGKDDTRVDTGKIRPGCGCNADPAVLVLFGAIALLGSRRRRAVH
ncbi:MAG: hypothetical protein QM817_14055 [Archangium sp.]